MLRSFKLSVCLLTVVCGLSSKEPTEQNERKAKGSYFQDMTRELGMEKDSGERQFQCSWNCQIVESDLVNITQTTVITKGRKLRLAFHYEKIVEDDCANRASRKPNGNLPEYWQLWLVNNTLPSFGGNVIRDFSALIQASFEDQVKVLCRFGKTDSSGKGTLNGELSPQSEHLENILRSAVRSLGEVCDAAQAERDAQTCIQISEFNHSARWKDFVLHGLIIAFITIFTYIGPTVICIYSATEDTLSGVRQITVEGPSPVGLRSLIGKCLFSTDNNKWHRAMKFIMHVVLLPILCLAPAIFVEYLLNQNLLPQQNMLRIANLFQPFRMFCYGCYCAHAFYFHILHGKPPDAEVSCCVFEEQCFNSQNHPFKWICVHHDLRQRMLAHLRPLCYYKTFSIRPVLGMLKDHLAKAKQLKQVSNETCCCGKINCLFSTCVYLFFLLCVPLFQLLLLILLLPSLCEFYVALSFPIATLCITKDFTRLWHVLDIHFLHRYLLFAVRVVVFLLNISLSCFAALGVMFVLRSAAVGVIIFLQLAVTFVLSEDNLPFVTCCVFSSLHLWISYRSFTQKYQDLVVNLFEHCDQLMDRAQKIALSWHDITPDYRRTTGNVKRIPKELFDMACEELMPVRKSICILVVKTSSTMIFIFLVFSSTTLQNTSTMVKALVALLTGSLPIIVNIYLDRRKQNCNFEEEALKVVHDYIRSRLALNPRQQRNYAYRGKFKNKNSSFQFFIHCFISVVVYLSFNVCSPYMALLCFINIVRVGRFPSTLSEISQIIYQCPLTSELICKVCLSTRGLACRACS